MTFRERARPPWWLIVAVFAVAFPLTLVTGDLSTVRAAIFAALFGALVAGYVSLVHVEVRDGVLTWARRGGGPRLHLEDIRHARLLHGAPLRELRRRLTPSSRLQCPVWERAGVHLVVDRDGQPVDHLVAVRDLDGFRDALGFDRWPEVVGDGPTAG